MDDSALRCLIQRTIRPADGLPRVIEISSGDELTGAAHRSPRDCAPGTVYNAAPLAQAKALFGGGRVWHVSSLC